jgi:hypothetical protein
MTCEELNEEYELYALGLSGDAERAELESHLQSGCSTCSAGLKRALVTNASILQLAPDVTPPRSLRNRVLASVGVEKKPWGWISGFAAALAGLFVAVVWFGAQDRQNEASLAAVQQQLQNSKAEFAQVQQALSMLNEPETKQVTFGAGKPQPPHGRVFVNARRGVLLLASNLPQAPAGKTYQLWVIPKGGAPKPAGLFQSDAGGNATYLSRGALDLSKTGAVAVTLEPEAGSPAPTTTPIIVAPVAE